MKFRHFFKIPYPKLILLVISFYVARLILTDENNFYFHPILDQMGYGATFLAGFLISFGFTFAPAAAALIVISPEQNIFLTWLVASLGAIVGNYTIFRLIKVSFEDEIELLSGKRLFQRMANFLDHHIPAWVRRYLLPIFAGIIVSTPLPDEIGVALISASRRISFPLFSAVTFIFSAFGIFILLLIGRLLS